jgi:hypothetical protein
MTHVKYSHFFIKYNQAIPLKSSINDLQSEIKKSLPPLSPPEPLQQLVYRLCPKLQRLHWDAFIGGMRQRAQIYLRRQLHRLEPVRLDPQAVEMARIGDP